MTLIVQIERNPRRLKKMPCYAEGCTNGATMLCDCLVDAPEGGRKVGCGRACCPQHGCYWQRKDHLCREHAEEMGKWG